LSENEAKGIEIGLRSCIAGANTKFSLVRPVDIKQYKNDPKSRIFTKSIYWNCAELSIVQAIIRKLLNGWIWDLTAENI